MSRQENGCECRPQDAPVLKGRKTMNKCTGNCNCCPCLLVPTSIELKNGIYTITVDDGAITGLCEGENFCINVRSAIPTDTECNIVQITDGTTTLDVCCNCQYWRVQKLHCRSIIVLKYLGDPAVAVLQTVKGRCK